MDTFKYPGDIAGQFDIKTTRVAIAAGVWTQIVAADSNRVFIAISVNTPTAQDFVSVDTSLAAGRGIQISAAAGAGTFAALPPLQLSNVLAGPLVGLAWFCSGAAGDGVVCVTVSLARPPSQTIDQQAALVAALAERT